MAQIVHAKINIQRKILIFCCVNYVLTFCCITYKNPTSNIKSKKTETNIFVYSNISRYEYSFVSYLSHFFDTNIFGYSFVLFFDTNTNRRHYNNLGYFKNINK